MYDYEGQCHCGAIQVHLSLPFAINSMTARCCDCDYCLSRNIQYISDCHGKAKIIAANTVAYDQQGSNQADFIRCPDCNVILCASFQTTNIPSPKVQESMVTSRIGAINATVLSDYRDIIHSTTVSPKQLSAQEKSKRWQSLWMPIEIEENSIRH